jgi:flagellin
MSKINTNISSLIARSNLSKTNSDLGVRLQRLSTGLRINKGSDDPAGLIISNRLGSEISGLQQAIKNSERASSVIATAEGSLAEVSDLLISIKGLLVEASNTGALSDEERQANQLQIDSAIESITRISNSASFGGLKLLNGSLDYILSGLKSSAISKATINSANFGSQPNLQVQVQTIASAQVGQLFIRGDYTTGALGPGVFQSSVSLEIAGPRGVQTMTVLSGRSLSEFVQSVNAFRETTGVSASLINSNPNSGMVLTSVGYGSTEFVSVKRIGEPATGGFFKAYAMANGAEKPTNIDISAMITAGTMFEANRDNGRDVFAVVNGVLGYGRGTSISLPNAAQLNADLLLNSDFATRKGSTTSFYLTGGGALYQLGGEINSSQQVYLSLPSTAASRLGGTLIDGNLEFLSSIRSGGSNDLNSRNFINASSIVATAIDEIAVVRGRLGALEKNTLETNTKSVQTAIENLSASQSVIRDADFATETAALSRAQILSNAGTSVLQLANQQSQNVLSLLRA